MEASQSQSQSHPRSNSLPGKPHPIFEQCDEHLQRLGPVSEAASLSTSSSISHKLRSLEDLHECVEKLLQLPLAQQAFVLGRGERWVDQALDGSLRLLDMCSAAKDAVLHTKECAREVQSAMRRRRGPEAGLEAEIRKYSASRKVVKKAVAKALASLKGVIGAKGLSLPSKGKDYEATIALFSALKEVQEITLAVFESLLCFVSGTKPQSKLGNWSLVAKLLQSKRVGCESEEKGANEFENSDATIQILARYETGKCDHGLVIENVKNQLQSLESCVQEFEEGLERLFRRLIRTRVSLLNILNN